MRMKTWPRSSARRRRPAILLHYGWNASLFNNTKRGNIFKVEMGFIADMTERRILKICES